MMENLSKADKAFILSVIVVLLVGVSICANYLYGAREHSRIAKEEIIEKLYPIDPIDAEEYSRHLTEIENMADLCYEELDADIPLKEAGYCHKYDVKVKEHHHSFTKVTTTQFLVWAKDEDTHELAKDMLEKVESISSKQKFIMNQIYWQERDK